MAKRRILLIDDEEGLARTMRYAIEERGGYEVRTEQSALAGLRAAKAFHPDLILLDVIMPEMDGGALAAQLKADVLTRDIPIVFLTAVTSKEEVGAFGGMISGHGFLAKPVDTDEVPACIGRYLAISSDRESL